MKPKSIRRKMKNYCNKLRNTSKLIGYIKDKYKGVSDHKLLYLKMM